jgi:hypothetical protein
LNAVAAGEREDVKCKGTGRREDEVSNPVTLLVLIFHGVREKERERERD